MLAINVSIPNLTAARLEQFRSPQLRIQRATNRRGGWLKPNHLLHESLMSLSSVRVHLQLTKIGCHGWQRPLDHRSRLCLLWIAWPRKPTLESNSESLAAIHRKLYQFKVYLPPHKGVSRSQRWVWDPSMFGMDRRAHIATDWRYYGRPL